jgi:hypothetical protein
MQQTKMTNLFERAGLVCRTWLAAALLGALAACGPGTGGTGTGPISFSGTLSGAAAGSATALPGVVCRTSCDAVSLALDEQRVELVAACRRFVYFGSWSVNAGGELVLDGSVETTVSGGTASAPGKLRVQFADKDTASQEATVTLTDAAGVILAGPAVLTRGVAEGGAPSLCERQ